MPKSESDKRGYQSGFDKQPRITLACALSTVTSSSWVGIIFVVFIASAASAQSLTPASQVPPRLPALTLRVNLPNPLPDQNVHVTATWDQQIYRMQYHFDWGDSQYTDNRQPEADHSYSRSGSYTVRVTASGIANDRVVKVESNELKITVGQQQISAAPMLTLLAKTPDAHVGNPVTFIATLSPPMAARYYHFNFDDGTESDSYNNEIVHSFRREGDFHPTVTASIVGIDQVVASQTIKVTINAMLPQTIPKPTAGPGRHVHKEQPPESTGWVLTRPAWNPTFGQYLLALLATGIAVASWRLFRRRRGTNIPRCELRITGYPDAGVHAVAHMNQSGPHLSLTFKPGMDPGTDQVIFSRKEAGSH